MPVDPATTSATVLKLIGELLSKKQDRETVNSLTEIQRYQHEIDKTIAENRQTYQETITSMSSGHAHAMDEQREKSAQQVATLQKRITALEAERDELNAKIAGMKAKANGPSGLQGMPTPFQVRHLNDED